MEFHGRQEKGGRFIFHLSAKTLDTTTAAKLANPSQIYSSLKGNIDAVASFSESGLKGVTVTPSQITARELQVAIPEAATSAQWEQINRAIEYGQGKKGTDLFST